jgi:protein SCO1
MSSSPVAASPAGARFGTLVSRLVAKPGFWALVIGLGLLIPIVNQVIRPPRPPLPVLGQLGAFSFTDQEGHGMGSEQLKGNVWVASFIFTRCPTICPAITEKLSRVQRRARNLTPGFKIVSFSVDPSYDTPEVLAAYAQKHKISPRMWHLLTGPLDAIRSTVEGGLKIALGESPQGEQDFASLLHGTHLVLVDVNLQIRGYYDPADADVVDHLLTDATMLLNRGN